MVITEDGGAGDGTIEGETVYQVIEPGPDSTLESQVETPQGWMQLSIVAAAIAGLGAGLFFVRKKLVKGDSDAGGLQGVCPSF